MQTLRNFGLTLALLLAVPGLLAAQPQQKIWQKLAGFPHRVLTVHFLELGGPPRIGFVGCDNAVYRTTDGGETWREATYILSTPNDPFMACDFTFKDSLVGWFANWYDDANSPYYMTTDAGQTWVAQSAPTTFCSAVYYNQATQLLFLSGWSKVFKHGPRSCVSTDAAKTWQVFQNSTPLNGYTFLDANYGVATNYYAGLYQHTTDGGSTWTDVLGGANETWQPVADPTNNLIFAASELYPFTLDRSSDKGLSFADIVKPFYSTGCMRSGSCGTLYVQRVADYPQSEQGIVVSNDQAATWSPVVDKNGSLGPFDSADRRFFVKGSYIYAPSSNNEIWRYIGDSTKYDGGGSLKPQTLLPELRIFASDCAPATKPLYIEYLNDCVSAQLIDAHIEPPDRFKLTQITLPQDLSGDVPIYIEHDPLSHTPDTARLFLTYDSQGSNSYDTVLLTSAISGDRYMPRVQPTANGELAPIVKSGDTITVAITLLDTIARTLGLDSISISTIFDSTILERAGGPILAPPFSLLREAFTLGTETLVIRIANSDISANIPLAKLQYRTYLTPERSAIYSVRDVRFNDSVFNGCIASARIDPPVLSIAVLGCGDSTARAFMRGEQIVQILGISTDAVTIRAGRDARSTLSIYNALGQCVQQQPLNLLTGISSTKLPMLRNGMYVCVVRSGGRAATASFVVLR